MNLILEKLHKDCGIFMGEAIQILSSSWKENSYCGVDLRLWSGHTFISSFFNVIDATDSEEEDCYRRQAVVMEKAVMTQWQIY